MNQVLLSATFVKQFRRLPKADQERVREGLAALADDATTKRSGADIKRLVKTKPVKDRLRVGEWRVVYYAEGEVVRVIEVFVRGRGYG